MCEKWHDPSTACSQHVCQCQLQTAHSAWGLTTAQAQEEAQACLKVLTQQQVTLLTTQQATLQEIAESTPTLANYLTPLDSNEVQTDELWHQDMEGAVRRCRLVQEMALAVSEVLESQAM